MSFCVCVSAWCKSPLPPAPREQRQDNQVGKQQRQVEISAEEEPLGQEAPVHCPLEEELPAQVKGPTDVAHRVLQQEGQAKQQLWVRRGHESAEVALWACLDRWLAGQEAFEAVQYKYQPYFM